MKKLQEILTIYNNKLIDLKYAYAIDLLDLVTDDEYALILEEEKDLFNPISGLDGEKYLHDEEILNTIIAKLTATISGRTPNPDEMDLEELQEYLRDITSDLNIETLRDIAKAVQTMLELN